MPSNFAFDHPDDAIRALASRLAVISTRQRIEIGEAGGRVLAYPVIADRDSPAADVSAMDGYAIRMSQLQSDVAVSISAESVPGKPAPTMSGDGVVRIFTGAIVPDGAEAVVKREDTIETTDEIRFKDSALSVSTGENIRRVGENAREGSHVIAAGAMMNAAKSAVAINFGCFSADVFAKVKVAVITTGDEVGCFIDKRPQPWQLQNSNRFALGGLLRQQPWIDTTEFEHCRDDRDSLAETLTRQLDTADAILLTGGVSMGDYDHVPEVVRNVGGEIVFHGLPLRPGKPILGAAMASGKLIVGLPGNPVSATIGCRRMAMPLLAKISGRENWLPNVPAVEIVDPDEKTLPLFWMRLVRLTADGSAEIVNTQGSGDLVSMSQSDGFIETAPSLSGGGPWPFYAW